MNLKTGLTSMVIVALISLCTFNGVAAAPASKLTPGTQSNYAADVKGGRQTYIFLSLGPYGQTAVTIGVGQSVLLEGVLSFDTPPTGICDCAHGIPDATINIQSLTPNGSTWSTVATTSTGDDPGIGNGMLSTVGWFKVTLTPAVAGVYMYRVTYDGDSQYAPSVSTIVTLTVTNVAIS